MERSAACCHSAIYRTVGRHHEFRANAARPRQSRAFDLNVFDILCPLRRIYARRRSATGKIDAVVFASKPLCSGEVKKY